MGKRSDKTNTGEGGKGKKGRTVSDDAGGKSLSDTSTSAGVKSTAIRTSVNIFEASKSDKPQYFVDKVKDKRRTKGNNLEFLIGWRGFPDPNHDTWEPLHQEKDTDEQVKSRSDLDELLGMSTTSMDFDVASVEGEGQLQAYIQVQQVPNDTDPLMWWKQHQQEFPDLARMARQDLTVPATSASPERFFSRVGLVQTDLRGSLLDTTMIDLMWAKQAP